MNDKHTTRVIVLGNPRIDMQKALKQLQKDDASSAVATAPKEMTFADHAEAWTREQGIDVPERGTEEWYKMYHKWHSFAFQNF